MKIEDIRVYDPKSDGIDGKQYRLFFDMLHAINPKAAYIFDDGLTERVLNSAVDSKKDLREFLWGEEGYLIQLNHPTIIIFMDGKFHSQIDGRSAPSAEELEDLSEKNNSIPFSFSYDPEIDHYLREREFTDILMQRSNKI